MDDQPQHQHRKDQLLRGILIDPYEKKVEEVYVEPYPEWKKLIECDDIEAVTIAVRPDGHRVTMWVDGEFLLNEKAKGPFFQIITHPQPMGGKALILNTDEAGETVGTDIPADLVRKHVTWPDVEFTGITTHEHQGETPAGPGLIIEQRSHFKPREPGSNSDPDEVD